ncbi:MAG: FGGY family carbohydrate kinase [Candidatus Ratteibacteria bacterium]|jgi:xylulokinase
MCGNDVLIGLDLGTSATKAVLIRLDGRVLKEEILPVSFSSPHKGWVEADAEERYQVICKILSSLASIVDGDVAAIAMAAASGNTLLTNATGMPLAPIINWMDLRAEQDPPTILNGLLSSEVSQITGWPSVRTFPLGHLAWYKEHLPDLYQNADHIGMDTDWFIYRLTDHWVMDLSTGATFHLVDQKSGDWHDPFLKMLEIPRRKLSNLVSSASLIAPLTKKASDETGLSPKTLVISGSFDHPSAARAVGVVDPGMLMLSCGTSWVGFTPCIDRDQILGSDMICDPFLASSGGSWGAIFSVPYIGRTIDWYVTRLIAPNESDPYQIFNEAAEESSSGAEGMKIDLRQEPSFIQGRREDISRAVMEGAARLLNEKIVGFKSKGFSFHRATMVGAPSESTIWRNIVAEIIGIDVVPGGKFAGAQGAAVLAGIGAGLYKDERDALLHFHQTRYKNGDLCEGIRGE